MQKKKKRALQTRLILWLVRRSGRSISPENKDEIQKDGQDSKNQSPHRKRSELVPNYDPPAHPISGLSIRESFGVLDHHHHCQTRGGLPPLVLVGETGQRNPGLDRLSLIHRACASTPCLWEKEHERHERFHRGLGE